jgi:hypothetical protein
MIENQTQQNGHAHVAEAMPTTIVLHLRREMDYEIRHNLLGTALKRIDEFCAAYDTDADGRELAKEVERDFLSDHPQFFIVLAVCGGEVIGHLLAKLDHYYGRTFCYFHQLEIDETVDRQYVDAGMAMVMDWARENRAQGLRAAVPSKAHERRLKWLYGFKPNLTVLEKELD